MKFFCCLASVAMFVSLSTNLVNAGDSLLIAQGPAEQAPKQPQAIIAPDGDVHLAYGVGQQVYHCRSSDGGKTFGAGQAAFSVPNLSLGMRRGPRIAATAKALVITAIGGAQGKGRDGDVLAWRSTDDGQSWQGPVRVNDVPASAREGLHAMAAGQDGTLWCVWLDLRHKRTELYACTSTDGGLTWSENIAVYTAPSGSICECCHPSIAIDGDTIQVLFRNSIDGNRDMYLASSTDGKSFRARRLGTEHWQLDACPMDGGMLSVESDGKVSTVWRRGGLVYATKGEQAGEILLGRGEQPWVASAGRGSIAVWTSSRQGELLVSPLASIEPRSIAKFARDPVIASSPEHPGQAVVFWESKRDSTFTIEATTIDFGGGKSNNQ